MGRLLCFGIQICVSKPHKAVGAVLVSIQVRSDKDRSSLGKAVRVLRARTEHARLLEKFRQAFYNFTKSVRYLISIGHVQAVRLCDTADRSLGSLIPRRTRIHLTSHTRRT